MSVPSHYLRWELHDHPYRTVPGMFVLDDVAESAESRDFVLVLIHAEAFTTPARHDPDPDELLTDALMPWLEVLAASESTPLRWSRCIYTRNRFGRHRAASDVSSLRRIGVAAATYEDESAMESHTLQPAENLTDLIRYTRRAGAGSLPLIAPSDADHASLLDRLISLRAEHGERLRLQHCAEELTPLGVIVLSREWDDSGEASREIVVPRTTSMPPLPYHRPQ
jgi:hypothetical protein